MRLRGLVSGGGGQASMFSFKGKDKGPAVEKKKNGGFKLKKTDSKKVC